MTGKSDKKPILLDSGNALFRNSAVVSESNRNAINKASQIAEAYQKIGYDAVAVGPYDLAAGAVFFDSSPVKKLPWISVNAYRADKIALCKPYLTIMRNGMRFAILGLTGGTSPHSDFILTDGNQELKDILPEISRSHDMVILLTTFSHEKALQLTKEFPLIDIIIGGDIRKGNIKGFLSENTLITQTAKQGKYLGDARISWKGRPWENNSSNILERLKASLNAVNRQIAGLRFKNNTRAAPADRKKILIQRRKDILEQIKLEESRVSNKPPTPGSTFSTVFFPLDGSIIEDPATKQLLEQPVNVQKRVEKL